jgi:hypothetical protein
MLGPLKALAERTGAAIVLIRHLNKGSGPALQRSGGSIGFVAAVCSAMLVAPDPEDQEDKRRVLAWVKTNLAPPQTSLAYQVEPVTLQSGIETSRIVWDGEVDLTADQLVGGESGQARGSKVEEA